jgi:outer membrane usher protein
LADGESTPKNQTQAQATFSLIEGVSLLAGYTRQTNRGAANIQTWNFGLTWSAGNYGNIFAGLLQSFAPSHSSTLSVVWTLPLGGQRYLQAASSRQGDSNNSSIEYDDAPPAELGWGVRLRRSFGDLSGDDVGGTYRTQTGDYSLAASNSTGSNVIQGEARGGFAIIGGHIIPTKWLDQSFALVTVPTSQPIDIYSNGVKVGHTNEDGYGFVPNLVAYEPNHVNLDASNLPLQMTVELSTHDVVPRSRAGVMIEFSATRSEGARATLAYADGRPIETGTKVEIESNAAPPGEDVVVALRGNVFFPDIHLPAKILLHTREGLCRINLDRGANDGEIPNLGVLRCAS